MVASSDDEVTFRLRKSSGPRCVLNGYVYRVAFCPLTVLECSSGVMIEFAIIFVTFVTRFFLPRT
jgi:hypothetical protein